MRAYGVAVAPPALDGDPGFSERAEDVPIEQFFIRPRFGRKRLFLGQVLWQADAMLFDRIQQ
jgi:hypothetical protein